MKKTMNKLMIFLLAALLILGLCACASSENDSVYMATRNGTDYTVDQENCTISDGTYTYQYALSGNPSGYSIEITYPDGSTYSWSEQRNSNGTGFGSGSCSDDYDAQRYADGYVLCGILETGVPKAARESRPGNALLGIVLLGFGLFNIVSPQTAWYLSEGWKFRDAEPSDLALGLARVGGGFCCLMGVIMIFV